MSEPLDRHEGSVWPQADWPQDDWRAVEMLVRAAGAYVRPSEELRPRVLEAARAESIQRSVRRRILQATLALGLLLGVASGMGGGELAAFSAGTLRRAEAKSADSGAYSSAEGSVVGWGMVESFTELRRRQADLLRFAR